MTRADLLFVLCLLALSILSIAFSHAAISSGYLFCFDNFFFISVCVHAVALLFVADTEFIDNLVEGDGHDHH